MFKLLIVDDEQVIREGIKRIIEKNNKRSIEFYEGVNGEEGLKLAIEQKPDIIITDVKMPLLDGLAMLKRLKTSLSSERLPEVIVISGYDEFQLAQKAIKLGVNNYLLKPIIRTELIEEVDKVCEKVIDQRQMRNQQINTKQEKLISWFEAKRENCNDTQQVQIDELLSILGGAVQKNRLEDHRFKQNVDIYSMDIVKLVFKEMVDRKCVDKITSLLTANANIIQTIPCHEEYFCLVKSDLYKDKVYQGLIKKINRLLKIKAGIIYVENNQVKIQSKYGLIKNYSEYCQFYGLKIEGCHKLNENDFGNINFDFELSKQWEEEFIKLLQGEIQTPILIKIDGLVEVIVKQKYSINIVNTYTKQLLFNIMRYLEIRGLLDAQTVKQIDKNIHNYQVKNIHEVKRWLRYQLIILHKCIISMKEVDGEENTILKINQYIKQHVNRSISLQELAKLVYLNPNYLCETYKKKTGMNLSEYMLRTKMEKAKELLGHKQLKTSEIARQVGYENPKYFSTVFKKYTGLSPKNYKNQKISM